MADRFDATAVFLRYRKTVMTMKASFEFEESAGSRRTAGH
jgi:hypothetical protein